MTVVYAINKVDSVIEVRVQGAADRPSVTRMWTDIVAACRKHQCDAVIGFSDLDQALRLEDAIRHDDIFREAGVTSEMCIAWMQLNPATAIMTELSVARVRNQASANIGFFHDEAEARQWLTEQSKAQNQT